MLKGCGLPNRLQGVLETESGTNDPISIYLTLLLAAIITTGEANLSALVGGVVLQLGAGAALGYAMGRGLVVVINRVEVDSVGLYPVLALAGGLLTYAFTELVGGNGFLAIYMVGIVLGNRPLVHRHNIQSFMDGMAWGAQILMFVLLGLLVAPAELVPHIPTALLLTVGLILVARPLSVMLTIAPLGLLHKLFRFSWREQGLLSWAGLKGAVPIILALVPLLNDVPGSTFIFNVTFVCVVVGTAVQGLSIAPLARWLGLTGAPEPEEPLRIELIGAAPPGSHLVAENAILLPIARARLTRADLRLLSDAPAVGQRLADLDIPAHMVVAAVVRNGTLIAPRGALRFQPDDHVYVIMEDAEANHLPRVFVPVASSPPSSS